MANLVKWPKVPSLSLDMPLLPKLISDSLGEVSKRCTPALGNAFRDRSKLSNAGRANADVETVCKPFPLKLRLFRLGNPLRT